MSQCLSPFYINTKLERNVPVPCGKCYYCVMRRISGWHFRLSNELKYAETASFVTLTYDNNFVPVNSYGELVLNKRDLQLFFKRLRKAVKKNLIAILDIMLLVSMAAVMGVLITMLFYLMLHLS